MNPTLRIENKSIGLDHKTYFIADIAANHDGNLQRALDLIHLAAEAGADAVKFQHFKADTIVSDQGFKTLGGQQSHQGKWKKSVFEVYQDASVNLEWTEKLVAESKKAGVTFFTSPYSIELVDAIDQYVPAYKIGSGDITWHEIIEHIASKKKPVMIAAGASNLGEVDLAMNVLLKQRAQILLMQCNTNYTASLENFKFISLNVLKTFGLLYPNAVLGLSDHTPGHSTVLGAVTLGARAIEKHFTDDNSRVGPDHAFAMNPASWKEMVERTRELENALGSAVKKVEGNELETVILQRRAIRLRHDMKPGDKISRTDLDVLRPCPADAIQPYEIDRILNLKLSKPKGKGDYLKWEDLIN